MKSYLLWFWMMGLWSASCFPGTAAISPVAAAEGGALSRNPTVSPPDPAASRSPIDFFRTLLTLPADQRLEAVADKSTGQQQTLLAKVEEYRLMPEAEREMRLRLLELRLYALPVLRAGMDQRGTLLERVPERDRRFVAARAREWDNLTATQQNQVLGNELNLHYFLYRGFARPGAQAAALEKITPPGTVEMAESPLSRLGQLTEEERIRLARRTAEFLKLPSAEQVKLLQILPPSERRQMDLVLRRFSSMPEEKREGCLDGLAKLAELSPLEHRAFLVQARRWQEMSPSQRSLLRYLAKRRTDAPDLPPLPTLR